MMHLPLLLHKKASGQALWTRKLDPAYGSSLLLDVIDAVNSNGDHDLTWLPAWIADHEQSRPPQQNLQQVGNTKTYERAYLFAAQLRVVYDDDGGDMQDKWRALSMEAEERLCQSGTSLSSSSVWDLLRSLESIRVEYDTRKIDEFLHEVDKSSSR